MLPIIQEELAEWWGDFQKEIDKLTEVVNDSTLLNLVNGRIDSAIARLDRIEETLSRRADRVTERSQVGRWGLVARLRLLERRCRRLERYNGLAQE